MAHYKGHNSCQNKCIHQKRQLQILITLPSKARHGNIWMRRAKTVQVIFIVRIAEDDFDAFLRGFMSCLKGCREY